MTSLVSTNQFRCNTASKGFFGARLQSVFLHGPGETIRDNADVAAGCGQPPAKRHQKIKGEPGILRALRSGLRLRAQTPAKRLSLPVSILRGITRSHPEHGS